MNNQRKNYINHKFLKELINSQNYVDIHNTLDVFLERMINQIEFLKSAIPQVIIADDSYRIIDSYFYNTSKKNTSTSINYKLKQWSTSLLGLSFHDYKDLSFYKKILDSVDKDDSQVKTFFCEQLKDYNNKVYLKGYYNIHEIDSASEKYEDFYTKDWKSEIVISSGKNTDLIHELGLVEWTKYFGLVIVKWPKNELSKRTMFGICAFLINPSFLNIASFLNIGNTEKKLTRSFFKFYRKNYNDYQEVTDIIQTSLYFTQIFGMIQSNTEDPFKLTELLLLESEKHLIFQENSKNKLSFSTLLLILNLSSSLVTRKLLRHYSEMPGYNGIYDKFISILKAINNPQSLNELKQSLKDTLPPYQEKDQEFFWMSFLITTVYSSLNNIHIFYRENSKQTDEFINDNLLPIINSYIEKLYVKNGEEAEDIVTFCKENETPISLDEFSIKIIESFENSIPHISSTKTWKNAFNTLKRLYNLILEMNSVSKNKIFTPFLNLMFISFHYVKEEHKILNEYSNLIKNVIFDNKLSNKEMQSIFKIYDLIDNNRKSILIEKIKQTDVKKDKGFIKKKLEVLTSANIRINKDLNDLIKMKEGNLNIYSFISTKGGVGKTALSYITANYLSKEKDEKTCLIDLDLFGPSMLYFILNENREIKTFTDYIWYYIFELAEKSDNVDEYLNKFKEKYPELEFKHEAFKNTNRAYLKDELDPFLINNNGDKLFLMPASIDETVKTYTYMLMTDSWVLDLFAYRINYLIKTLKKQGFKNVIFDCPAEFKELTIQATKITVANGGINYFVSTIAVNSIVSSLNMMSTGYFKKANNHLLINKIRKSDASNFISKNAIIDYLSSFKHGMELGKISDSYKSILLNFKQSETLNWDESLENLFNINNHEIKCYTNIKHKIKEDIRLIGEKIVSKENE